MIMINQLLLLSGTKNDIPFLDAQINIHQPTIREIAYVGEKEFFTGCGLLNFSKEELLEKEDILNLQDSTNFEILMSIITDNKNPDFQKVRVDILRILALLFPAYEIKLEQKQIVLISIENKEEKVINNNNFERFKEIVNEMFCLSANFNNQQDYNPSGELAKEIANKLKKGREKASQEKPKDINLLSRYVSILAVGEQKDMNDLLDYTVYQIYDEYERFGLKLSFDMNTKAKMMGAKDLPEVDNWMKDIHNQRL